MFNKIRKEWKSPGKAKTKSCWTFIAAITANWQEKWEYSEEYDRFNSYRRWFQSVYNLQIVKMLKNMLPLNLLLDKIQKEKIFWIESIIWFKLSEDGYWVLVYLCLKDSREDKTLGEP